MSSHICVVINSCTIKKYAKNSYNLLTNIKKSVIIHYDKEV